ncbi:MAG: hypothetical protein LBR77_10935 [Lachnospiraceae bacterium]|jgi:hypothetical protein|nr:hypothetical protein [Lachnospiraceae bacterium]
MELHVAVFDPAGNRTLIVTDPVPPGEYGPVARRLMDVEELGGEQVGFLVAPKMGGQVRLEMMGGEFCGNALRCAGLYHALQEMGTRTTQRCAGLYHALQEMGTQGTRTTQHFAGENDGSLGVGTRTTQSGDNAYLALEEMGMQGTWTTTVVRAEISGCGHAMDVKVAIPERRAVCFAEAQMPLPALIVPHGGFEARVEFDGIAHFIVRDGAISEKAVERAVTYAKAQGLPACGVMFLDEAAGCLAGAVRLYALTPVVYVRDTDSLVYESSCASGSSACAAYLAQHETGDTFRYEFDQPGGTIGATIEKDPGGTRPGVTRHGGTGIKRISIGGAVGLLGEAQVEADV